MEATTISSLNIFKGKKVLSNTGNECGIIKDFLIDKNNLDVKFVIISEGNVSNNHYIIAPFGAMTFDNPHSAQQTLNVPLEKLLRVASLQKGTNLEEQASFSERIRDHYGTANKTPPYQQQEQSSEGSSQITDNIPSNNIATNDEVAYNDLKEKNEGG